MPEGTAVAAPAPAAPAAPAPTAPAAAPSAGVAGIFDGLMIEERERTPEPDMDPPLGQAGTPAAPEAKSPEPAKPPEEEPKPEGTTPAEPAKPVEPAPGPGTESFKTRAALEVAYMQSSNEGKRLAAKLKEVSAETEKAQVRLRELETELALGPEIAMPSDEELEAMGPIKAAKLIAEISQKNTARLNLKEKREQAAKQQQAETARNENAIRETARKMESDKTRYPDYAEMKPIMEELIDYEPGFGGHPSTPLILYLAAKGIRAAEADKAAKGAAAQAEAAAKAKAAADAAGAGGSGAPGSEKTPAGGKAAPGDDSDEAHNAKLIGFSRKSGIFAGI